MAYTVRISARFKKDFKRCMTRGLDMKLMTWEQHDNELTLLFLQTGTHADLFGW